MKIKRIKPFWILAIAQALIAFSIFLNEVMAIFNMVPGGNYPIEHKSSWLKVIIFCSGAIISCFVVWFLDSKQKRGVLLPPLLFVLPLGICSTLLSTVFSHYLSLIGWCCEHPLSFYFGFPFSYLLGIGSFIYSEMQPYENYGLLKILVNSEPQVHWKFLPYDFFLDFLFWSNIVFILLSLVIFFRQKEKLLKLTKEASTI